MARRLELIYVCVLLVSREICAVHLREGCARARKAVDLCVCVCVLTNCFACTHFQYARVCITVITLPARDKDAADARANEQARARA